MKNFIINIIIDLVALTDWLYYEPKNQTVGVGWLGFNIVRKYLWKYQSYGSLIGVEQFYKI